MIRTCPNCGSTNVSSCGGDMHGCNRCGNVFYDRHNKIDKLELLFIGFTIALVIFTIIVTR